MDINLLHRKAYGSGTTNRIVGSLLREKFREKTKNSEENVNRIRDAFQ
jgi:hypothetical protein